ncbi:zinc finger protein 606 isoform X6 [Echinops telfairi]|uniref:Zinc finger protein 606 isoform X6 n=1 Tax=Echinops telfairi TaxID=9371 RepID=A0AC55D915_ECHTE|nr:zinc finger protein 606 isoform X6 [Echinops telfairi]
MAAINPWTSWGALTDQYWGMAAISPWASCVPITCHGVVSSGSDLPPPRVRAWKPALCPRDPVWPMEGTPEEARRTTWLPTDQIQCWIWAEPAWYLLDPCAGQLQDPIPGFLTQLWGLVGHRSPRCTREAQALDPW